MSCLADKVVVITGSAFGIGRAIAQQAAAAGAKVVIADLPAEHDAGEWTAKECEAEGSPGAMYVPCDVSEGKQVAALMEAAAEAYGGIDVVYANAGVVSSALVLSRCQHCTVPAGWRWPSPGFALTAGAHRCRTG